MLGLRWLKGTGVSVERQFILDLGVHYLPKGDTDPLIAGAISEWEYLVLSVNACVPGLMTKSDPDKRECLPQSLPSFLSKYQFRVSDQQKNFRHQSGDEFWLHHLHKSSLCSC